MSDPLGYTTSCYGGFCRRHVWGLDPSFGDNNERRPLLPGKRSCQGLLDDVESSVPRRPVPCGRLVPRSEWVALDTWRSGLTVPTCYVTGRWERLPQQTLVRVRPGPPYSSEVFVLWVEVQETVVRGCREGVECGDRSSPQKDWSPIFSFFVRTESLRAESRVPFGLSPTTTH